MEDKTEWKRELAAHAGPLEGGLNTVEDHIEPKNASFTKNTTDNVGS